MLRRRRSSLALVALLCLLALGGPGPVTPGATRAAVPVDAPEFQGLRAFLTGLGFGDEAIAQIAAETDPDKLSDWFDQGAQTPTIRPAGSDIVAASFFEIHTTLDQAAAWRMPGGPLHCDSAGVICPKQPANGAWGPDFVAYSITTAVPPAPIAGGRQEMGASILFDTAAGDAPPPWQRLPAFAGDFFHAANAAYSFRSEAGGPFAGLKLVHDPASQMFVERPTDAVAVVTGRTTIGIIPEADSRLVVNGRLFTFTGSAQGIAIDTYPDIDEPPMSYADIPEIELGLAAASPSATATPSVSAPPSQAAVASDGPVASPSAAAVPAPVGVVSTTTGFPWLLVVLAGIVIAAFGGILLLRGSRAGATVAGGAASTVGGSPTSGGPTGGAIVAGGVASEDPCPPLIAAAKAAQAACDEAMKAASAAADAARARTAEADAARSAREKARAAREEAERELDKRRQPPDPGRRLGETSYEGRDIHVDEYDLWLQEQARAAANAAHKAALGAATSDAERQQAHDAWMKELEAVDGADGLDEVRRRDKDGRERWIKEAEASLASAQEAEAAADAEVTRTAEAATAAETEAAAAKATADDACARAEVAAAAAADCISLQTPVVPRLAGAPEGQGETPPPPPPPTPPTTPTPGPVPPGTTPKRPCPEGSEPRVSTSGAFEVELFVLSSARLNIDGAFMFDAAEGDAAIEGFETATAASDVAVGLIGAVTDPVGSILGSLGVPSFDTVTQAPTAAAQKALNRLNEQLRQKRKIGTWTITVPKQRFRFSCRVTESCVDGEWVVSAREFRGERIGTPTYIDSAPYELVDVRESDRAWTMMSTPFIRQNRVAERMIASAATACGG